MPLWSFHPTQWPPPQISWLVNVYSLVLNQVKRDKQGFCFWWPTNLPGSGSKWMPPGAPAGPPLLQGSRDNLNRSMCHCNLPIPPPSPFPQSLPTAALEFTNTAAHLRGKTLARPRWLLHMCSWQIRVSKCPFAAVNEMHKASANATQNTVGQVKHRLSN